jgi:hypothetical protein
MEKQSIITNFVGSRNENTLCCSALFAEKKQTWGLIFSGNKTIPTKYTWNFIDQRTSHNKQELLKE